MYTYLLTYLLKYTDWHLHLRCTHFASKYATKINIKKSATHLYDKKPVSIKVVAQSSYINLVTYLKTYLLTYTYLFTYLLNYTYSHLHLRCTHFSSKHATKINIKLPAADHVARWPNLPVPWIASPHLLTYTYIFTYLLTYLITLTYTYTCGAHTSPQNMQPK